MITINQVVLNKKGQKGVINRIITKSTGYVEVVYENGTTKKEMAFNLTDEMGSSLKKAPKKQEPRTKTALEAAIEKMRWLNSCTYGDRFSPNYEVAAEPVIAVEMAARAVGNEFIQSVCQSVIKYMRCSSKQAYVLGKFAIENCIII